MNTDIENELHRVSKKVATFAVATAVDHLFQKVMKSHRRWLPTMARNRKTV